MSFNDRKEQRKEKYKKRICYWCKRSIKECAPECQCIFCIFDEKFESWKKEYPNVNKWFKKNIKFYDKLFRKGLAKETKLADKWKRHQLDVVEKTGTKIQDWSADFEVIDGEREIIANEPGDFQIITPYYDYIKRKTDFRYNYHCQICGQDIVERYFIKHRERRICIGIGIDCAIIFHYADELTKNVKHDMDGIIRKEFYRLKPFLRKSIEERLRIRRVNRKWLLDTLRIITGYGKKNNRLTAPEKLAKLLLELDKRGFKIFDKGFVEKEIIQSPASVNDNASLILKAIEKLGSPYGYAVNKNQLIQEMQEHRMSEKETNEGIEFLLKSGSIFEFTPESYKISINSSDSSNLR